MSKVFRTAGGIGSSAILSVAVLAGCSSPATTSSTDAVAESSAVSSADGIDATVEVLPPTFIDVDQTAADVKVGDVLDIGIDETTLEGTTVSTDAPALIELTQPKFEDGALFDAGASMLAVGTATITVTSPDGSTRTIVLTITK